MKVALIVHYFPPLNSTGARRPLAFAKFLHRFGHQVSVVTTHKHPYDGPLTEEVPTYCDVVQLGRPPSPGRTPPATETGTAAPGRGPVATRVLAARRALMQVTGQLLDNRIPFGMRFRGGGLTPDALRVLSGADVIVSSMPPWPVHLAAWFAARRFDKPWLADYRDQWSGNHMYPGSRLSLALERRMEARLLSRASAVSVISGPMAEHYRSLHPAVTIIENGYDADVFAELREEARSAPSGAAPGNGERTVRFVGSVSRESVPRNLFQAMRSLPAEARDRIRIEFHGEWKVLVPVLAAEFPDLADRVRLSPPVPHREAMRLMLGADALLFSETSATHSLSARGVLTTKLFEYLAAERPILADIEPTTLAGGLIVRSGLGAAVSRDPTVLGAALLALTRGGLPVAPDRDTIGSFSRERQARRLEAVLERLVREHGRGR